MFKFTKNKTLQIGIFIIALITLAPLLYIKLVSADDLVILQISKWPYWENAYLGAVHQGRFFFLLTSFFFYLPYYFDSIIWTKILQFIPIIFIFLGFNKVISCYFNKRKAGLLFLLIFFIFFQITANFNIFISYHLYFTSSIACLIWGFRHFQLYFKYNNKKNLYVSCILFAVSLLFYEVNIVYSFFYFSLAYVYVRNEKFSFLKNISQVFKKFKGHLLIILVYIILMFFWSFLHPSQYEGNQFAKIFSFANYFKAVLKFINGALPLNNFFGSFKFFLDRSQDIGGFNPLTFMFSDTFPISSYLKLLLIPFIFLSLIKISKNISFSKIYLGIINGFLLLVFPALFLSLSYKYSTSQMEHYTITVFQFFGTTLFFMCIFLWIDKKFINSYWVTILSRVIVLIFLLFTSLAHDYANNMYANDLKLSQSRFTFMDDFIKTDYYDKIGNKDIIYAPSLWNSVAYSEESKRLTEQGFNWGYFSNLIYNKDRNIIRDKEDLINKCNLINSKAYFYSFVLIQAYQTTDIMLVAAKINKNQYKKDSFFSDTVDVFIYSNNNKGIINYKTNLILSDSSSISKYNAIIIKKDDLNNKIWHKRIENKQIEIQSINISFMN